jgi:hypothetical protein
MANMKCNVSKWEINPYFILIITTLFILLTPTGFYKKDKFGSCTIFTVTKNGQAFFANNEDEGLLHGRLWFYPSLNEKHGKLLFGYPIGHDVDIYVGGMNDQGLCFDGNMVHQTSLNRDPTKEDILGTFCLQMLDVCKTIEDVINWSRNYNLHLLNWQQVHIADKNGNAIVLGLNSEGNLTITEKTGDFLISTNSFNLAQEHTFCWRYDLVETRLNSISNLTLDDCKQILDDVQLDSTMYSYIINLNNGDIFLYSLKNFEHYAVINAFEEISKGIHSYSIHNLVSQQSGNLFMAFNYESVITVLLPSFILTIILVLSCAFIYFYKIRTILN